MFFVAYARAFRVMPASDDWPIVNEIHRGNHRGVHVFFTDSVIRIGYRPLKSVVIWAFGNLGSTDQQHMAWIRVPHLLAALLYALVAALWARAIPLARTGALVTIAIMLLHPVLPQAAGSVDGIDTLASSALLWLGAWCIMHFRDRIWPATVSALACFVVGVGFKENLFALVPLSVVLVQMFWTERRRSGAAIIGVTLALAALGMILLRRAVIAEGLAPGAEMLRLHPLPVLQNAAHFATALLFFGNSIWAFVNWSTRVQIIVGISCLLTVLLICAGLYLRTKRGIDYPHRKWLGFLACGLALSSFPTILLYHVSEMYVPPMLLPLALLCGMAADGFAGASIPMRAIAGAAAAVAVVSSLLTIRAKIGGLVDIGQRAYRQLQQVVSYLPLDARDKVVAIRYLYSDLRPRDLYAVFRMPDSHMLIHRDVLDFARPYRGLVLDADQIEDFSEIDMSKYDLVLGWDKSKQRFIRLDNRATP